MDEDYIKEILQHIAKQSTKPKDRAEFIALCTLDINQGYRVEVEEACRRYFSRP